MTGPVRRVLGERDAQALSAGVGLPTEVQCWGCGDGINVLTARPGSIALSVVAVTPMVNIPAWGHPDHAPSQVFTPEQFERVATRKPSPVAPSDIDTAMIIDGQRYL